MAIKDLLISDLQHQIGHIQQNALSGIDIGEVEGAIPPKVLREILTGIITSAQAALGTAAAIRRAAGLKD